MPPSWPPADTLPSPLPRPSLPPPKAVPPSLQVECYKLLTRLLQIPQVEPWIRNTAEYVLPPRPFHTRFIMPGSLSSQAVELLHATFCLGAPLCTLLDMLGSPSPPSLILDHDPRVFPYRDITIPEREEYIHSFIQRVGLLESTKKIKYGEVMRSSDLFSTTSIGWAKVLKTVHRVVDGLQETYPGVYAQPEDAVSRKEDLFLLFEQSERDQVQLIKQLKDKLVALGISHNPLLESVIANLERIEEWHERTLSSWKSSLSVEELLDWDAVLGPTTGDQLRSTALAAYRSLCVGLCGLADYLTSAKLAHSGHHNGPEILRHISHMLRQIPNYVHILEQLTMCLCPPLSAIDDVVPQPGSRLKKTSEPIFTNSLSSSPSMSFISVHSTAPTKPSLYGIAARASSLMTLRRTASAASTLSSSSSIRAGTITGEPIHASPQSTIGRSVSYETSRSPEDLAAFPCQKSVQRPKACGVSL
ncbi:hypothetical protein DL96DRAFT_1592082 [Flagelloscypha sp. PMI_526]|nr:hypothetical protein DL96DRAFT_1592082 [Flagelloscypha sp. PMI_526]